MSHRRRGADFTQAFESFFGTADCGTDPNMSLQDRISTVQAGNSADSMPDDAETSFSRRANTGKDSAATNDCKSAILAGRAADTESQGSTENSYRTARSGSPPESPTSQPDACLESFRSQAPSLMNRPIEPRFVPQTGLDLSSSTTEPRTSDEFNRNIEISAKSSRDSRDTNYNIKNSRDEAASSSVSVDHDSQTNSTKFGEKSSTPIGIDHESSNIIKRFSREFIFSPQRFTEKLVGIIDENETDRGNYDNTGCDLSRMTMEFRKMCKFIQDESMPENMNSFLGTTRQNDENKFHDPRRPETIEESPNVSFARPADSQTPEARKNDRKIYRKTPLNIFKRTATSLDREIYYSPCSPNSTRNFVNLEKYLNDNSSPGSLARSARSARSASSSSSSSVITERLRDKMRIVEKCERQLASLDDTKNCPEFETFDSHPRRDERENETCDGSLIDDDDDASEDEINEDELSMSLRAELAKKRERCFETARQMRIIEEDGRAGGGEDYPKILKLYGIVPEIECRRTIESLVAYQKCWTRLRRYDRARKNELSSHDSGIDTRSLSRTHLRASLPKKSRENAQQPSGDSSARKNRNNEISTKQPSSQLTPSSGEKFSRTGSVAKATTHHERRILAARNIFPKITKNLVADTRKRTSGAMCPNARALARSRSRSREKLVPRSRRAETKENFCPIATSRADLNRGNFLTIPKNEPERAEILENKPNPRNDEREILEKIGRATPGRCGAKISNSRFNVASPSRASPNIGKTCKDRVGMAKIGRAKSPISLITTKSPRNRFFVTPGRTVPIKDTKRRSKEFFPSINSESPGEVNQRIMKSLHAPGIYRKGFNTVISPIHMYIHGTDMNLIQNVQGRKDETLLTPKKATASVEKLKFKLYPETLRDSPRRNRIFSAEKDSESQSDDNDENQQKPDFILPKAIYEPSARVKTVNQSPRNVGGQRARELLESIQNRVVIHHKKKIAGKCDESDVPESGSDSVDMSVHVLRSVEKTNFANRRK